MEASGLSASGGLARKVKINEIEIDHNPIWHMYKTDFSLIFMQHSGIQQQSI